MTIFEPTGQTFASRKKAKDYFGVVDYNQYLKQHLFRFTSNNI